MSHERVAIEVPEPHFTLFNATRSGKPEVIVVNDSLLKFEHIAIFPWHLEITLEAEELIDNGMPAPEESELLFKIGDEIEGAVLSGRTENGANNALFLARSTWDGCRQLLFQVHDPEVTHTALQALLSSRSWQRQWDYSMKNDSQWSTAGFVFQLFPQAGGSDA